MVIVINYHKLKVLTHIYYNYGGQNYPAMHQDSGTSEALDFPPSTLLLFTLKMNTAHFLHVNYFRLSYTELISTPINLARILNYQTQKDS